MEKHSDHIKDADTSHWVQTLAPVWARPFLQLARYDRPIGFWLLVIPCWAGMALANLDQSWNWVDLWLAILFGVGALLMRGAGCTYNDILDRDLDAKVARTRNRPLVIGTITLRQAIWFLVAQGAFGFAVWLCLPDIAKWVAISALPLVALYPVMKRITWWPQAWLGLTFNWGALVGFVAVSGELTSPALWLYAGLACWTLGYDTIYAHQDREDDALIGVKSTARLFGKHSKWAIAVIYFICLGLLMLAGITQAGSLEVDLQKQADYAVFLATGLLTLNLSNQAFNTDFDDADKCLKAFRSNQRFGIEYVILLALAPLLMTLLIQMQA